MRVPVSWLRDFIESDAAPAQFADALTRRGFAVESISVQPTPERIVVGRVLSLERHPNADRLLVSTVDIGNEKLQIVTGATNVSVGDKVPIAKAGAVVYERGSINAAGATAASTKRIERSSLRGIDSNGMMCSPDELALPGEYGDGILIMEEDAPVGQDFWRVARFGDAVLDVEVPSNRPDGLSIIGLAREAAAGLRAPFKAPAMARTEGDIDCPVSVSIEAPHICRRLIGQCFLDARNRRSPTWMALRLAAAGVRSLNLFVDISNFVQIEVGQPLHFYDVAKLRGAKIIARAAQAGERVVTLDGVERALPEGSPVIADAQGPLGIAGIMGGAASGVSMETTELFIESPNFVGPAIRRAAIAVGLRTEGALRHEKDLPLELPEVGRRRAAQLLVETGAKPTRIVETGEQPGDLRHVRARAARVNELLGSNISVADMKGVLGAIGLEASGDGELEVIVPYWRTDVTQEVDVVEEVARGIGYDAIPEARVAAAPQAIDQGLFDQETLLAGTFAALGYHEIRNIPLQGNRLLAAWERSGIPYWQDLVEVRNPLSEEQRFLRPSLLPGLLETAAKWWPKAEGELRLFEVGHIFHAAQPQGTAPADLQAAFDRGVYTENGVIEWPSLAGLLAFKETDFKGSLDPNLLSMKGDVAAALASLVTSELASEPKERRYFHPGAAGVLRAQDGVVAKFGRVHPKLARAFELPPTTYAFALYLENIPHYKPVARYRPLPKFPATTRDIAVVVDAGVSAGELTNAARTSGAPFLESVRAFDEYQGPQIGRGRKSVALSVVLRKPDATITDDEANSSKDAIVAVLASRFGATLRE
jgi:phenylalanyl-tRNA synthetase beta chain